MSQKIVSDVDGSEIKQKESVSVAVSFYPYDDETWKDKRYEYDISVEQWTEVEKAIRKLFPKADRR